MMKRPDTAIRAKSVPGMVCCAFLLLLFAFGRLAGQESPAQRMRAGGFVNFAWNNHNAAFRALPGVPSCCPEFSGGSGAGFALGALFEYYLPNELSLNLRLGYYDYSAELSEDERRGIVIGNELVSGLFRHEISSGLGVLALEPMAAYPVYEGLSVQAGLQLGFLLHSTYEQRERFIEPRDAGVFENGQRIRNVYSGDIPDAAGFSAALVAGLRYELPLNHAGTLNLLPELLYSYGLSDIAGSLDWQAGALRVGLALAWDIGERREQLPPVIPAPGDSTPPLPVEVADSETFLEPEIAITAVWVKPDGSWVQVDTVRVAEYRLTKLHPLLNYIFFDENSAEIPPRYVRLSPAGSARFRPEHLFGEETLAMYHNVLNLVGERMRRNGAARLRIVGCNADIGPEQGNTDLAQQRAEAVKRYLQLVWRIAPERLIVESRNLPEKPSNSRDAEGRAENRRVELYATEPGILDYVLARDTRVAVQPGTLRFIPIVNQALRPQAWRIDARAQNGQPANVSEGQGAPPTHIDWNIENARPMQNSGPITYDAAIQISGKWVSSLEKRIPLHYRTVQAASAASDNEVGDFSLILFEFGESRLGESNRAILEQIAGLVPQGSSVIVRGYTDRIGESDFNMRLASSRADAVAQELRRRGVSVRAVESIGESDALYDNSLPEGRFYSRTVRILSGDALEETAAP